MDTVDADTREALEQAVAENPEEVAAFIEHLGLVNDLLDTTDLAASTLEGDMAVSLAHMSASLGELADATTGPAPSPRFRHCFRPLATRGTNSPSGWERSACSGKCATLTYSEAWAF